MEAKIMQLKNCNYCGNEGKQYTIKDHNLIGEVGYKSTIVCDLCKHKVERWAKDKETAEKRVSNSWNGVPDDE